MGHWLPFESPHGRIHAWRADPAGTPRGALVVVQEIFGVNPHIRTVAEGFARVHIGDVYFDHRHVGALDRVVDGQSHHQTQDIRATGHQGFH
mgnify:CR=1 FL=1